MSGYKFWKGRDTIACITPLAKRKSAPQEQNIEHVSDVIENARAMRGRPKVAGYQTSNDAASMSLETMNNGEKNGK